jgi:hypothetical protein
VSTISGEDQGVISKLDIEFSKIGALLDLSCSKLKVVDISSAEVGELRLGPGEKLHRSPQGSCDDKVEISWYNGSKLSLRDTHAKVYQDLKDLWPETIDLEGFKYNLLGNLKAGIDPEASLAKLEAWLTKQSPYSPEPYEQAASVLKKAGSMEVSNNILYVGRERELKQAWKDDNYLLAAWLFLLKIFIGYGYRVQRTLYWVTAFVFLGALIFRQTREAATLRMPYGLAYSFDMLLPVIKLREKHYDIDLPGWERYYFYFHKVMGYLLASFLIAGVSGLTK